MNKKLLRIFLIIGMTLLLTSCSDIPLKAVKGSGVTSAEQFKSYDFLQSYVLYDAFREISSLYTISIIPSSDNPLEKIDIEAGKDLVGNELKEQLIAGSTPFFEQKLTTDSALNYTFFEYDEETKNVHTVKTQANEFYTYNNGNIYHIGYFVDHERFNKRA